MAFELLRSPSIEIWMQVLGAVPSTSLRERMGGTSPRPLAIDGEGDAYLVQLNGTDIRQAYAQFSYLLLIGGSWLEVRTLAWYDPRVSFYGFPTELEIRRHFIERRFSDAVAVFGYMGDESQQFSPVFVPDNYFVESAYTP